MKKLLIFFVFLISFGKCFSQPIVNQGSTQNTVQYPNLFALRSFRPAVYLDTTHANNDFPTLDSCGRIIFTYSDNALWQRQCNPKKWVFVGGLNIFNSTSIINIISTTVNTTTISICNGNNVCDTLTVNTTVQNISTAGFINDSTIVLCDTIQNCDTVHIPQQQVFTAQNGTKFVSPGVLEWGTNPLLHNTTIPTNGVDLTFTQTQTGGFNITQTHNGSNAGLQLNNPSSIGLGFSGNGDINSSNTNISLKGFGGLTNIVSQFYGGITFPLFPNTVDITGLSNKFLSTDGSGNIGFYSPTPNQGCGLIDGLVVTFDSTHNGQGVYDVSAGSVCINNNTYNIPFTVLTLPQGDSTNPRQDAFIADTLSTDKSIQGTPATNPEVPQANPISQYFLTSVFINALDSIPVGVNIRSIYDQNLGTGGGEFTPSSTGVAVNYANTVNPAHLTIAADVGAIANNNRLTFINNANLSLSDFSAFKFYIRLKSTWATNVRMSFQWMLGTTVLNTNNVNIGGNASAFNFSRTTVGAYQVITIPTSAWVMNSNSFDRLRITFTGANAQGIYLDWIQLQGGIQQGGGGGTNGTVTSVASAGNVVFTPIVTNPTSNVNIINPLNNAGAYTVLGNFTNASATPTYATINLSTPITTGLLNISRLGGGTDGQTLQNIAGVWTPVNQSTGYDTTFVLPPLFVLPGTINDTLGIHLFAGTNITIDSTADGMTINATGGGGSSLFPVTGTGTATGAIIGDLAGNTVQAQQGGNNFLVLDPTVNSENASIGVINNTGDGNNIDFKATATDTQVEGYFEGGFNDGVKSFIITGHADASTSTLTYTADTHTFNGSVAIANYIAGASTDSVVTWDAATQVLKMRNASSFGGSFTLTNGNGTTANSTAVDLGGAISINPTVISLAGKQFAFIQSPNTFLDLDATPGAEGAVLQAYNTTGGNNVGSFAGSTSNTNAQSYMFASFNGGVKLAGVQAVANTSSATITYAADTHTFTGPVFFSNQANLKNYTVATLPSGTRGDIAYVTDALLPSFLVTIAGGGAVVTPVFFDGSSWKAF